MAIKDALLGIATNWSSIVPLLGTDLLEEVARLDPSDGGDESAERLFALLAPVLPASHPAWALLRSNATRREGQPVESTQALPASPQQVITLLARQTVTFDLPQQSADDDPIAPAVQRSVLAAGYRVVETDSEPVPATLLGVSVDTGTAYPEFQFTGPDSFEPVPAFVVVSQLLDAYEDPVGALSWWLTTNTWIGTTPASLLGSDDEAQVHYAASQLNNDSW